MSNYLISISKNEALNDAIIHDISNKLKVRAFDLIQSSYTPNKEEIQFFVTAGKQTVAFETEGYQKHRQLHVLQMISWYCNYLGLIEAEIHPNRPIGKIYQF
jgi:hypothetical protein